MAQPSTALTRLAGHPRVEHADDERACGNGVIVTLRQGWTWDMAQDNRVRGFDTLSDALQAVRHTAQAFDGPFTN